MSEKMAVKTRCTGAVGKNHAFCRRKQSRCPKKWPQAIFSNEPAGFTLIEVLVALAIVTVGMAALLSTVTSSADTTIYLRDKTFAQWVALNRIAEVRLQPQLPSEGDSEGDVEYAGRRWHWRQEVNRVEVPGVLRIDVMVRPADIKAGDDEAWFANVSGVKGDALAQPNGQMPLWSNYSQQSGGPSEGEGAETPPPGSTPEPPPETEPPEAPEG